MLYPFLYVEDKMWSYSTTAPNPMWLNFTTKNGETIVTPLSEIRRVTDTADGTVVLFMDGTSTRSCMSCTEFLSIVSGKNTK